MKLFISRSKRSKLIRSLIMSTLILTAIQTNAQTEDSIYTKPSWYFGVAGGANFNFFRGSTQRLSTNFTSPTVFHNGFGVGLYVAPLIEYRPSNSVLGVMLQAGYDSRMGKFDQVITPCNCPADLSTTLGYIVIEPSLRIAPFKNGFYMYLGPRMAINVYKGFKYQLGTNPLHPEQIKEPEVQDDFSFTNATQISAQVGMGYDIHMTSAKSRTQFVISPFASFQPYFGQTPRAIETWNITTLRGGIALKIGRGHKVATVPVLPVSVFLDRDGDGIADNDDRCPDVKGLASLQGCPDRDGDGIADMDDRCPDMKGSFAFQGCPDKDGDGIADIDDKCPDVAGLLRYQGCPIPDTDMDGVNDEEDKCVTIKGPASNFGCPIITKEDVEAVNMATHNIYFVTASAKLKTQSFMSLDDVVTKLKENPAFKVEIDGHTDYVGTEEYNHDLSHERATSVKEYLISHGIDESRITSKGYGETQPIADNATEAGRAKNRRVEMTLRVY